MSAGSVGSWSNWRWWVAGAAIGLPAAAALMPATGWIVRQHLRAGASAVPAPALLADLGVKEIPVFGSVPATHVPATSPTARQVADRFPGEYPPALSQALTGPGPTWGEPMPPQSLDLTAAQARVRPLVARFANSPAVYADLIREACLGRVLGTRPEQYLIEGMQPPPPSGAPARGMPAARQLASVCDAARTGERLEPGNAYFPFMLAAWLLAADKDAEAMEALARAGRCAKWDDHIISEVTGRWRITSDLFGDRGSLPRAAMAAAVLLPHFSVCRALTRVATYKAIELEAHGRRTDALRIRHALLSVASRMRHDSTTGIGTLVAASMAAITVTRPGGVPAPARAPGDTPGGMMIAQRIDAYTAYLRSTGQAAEADWTTREFQAQDEAARIVRSGAGSGDWLASLMAPALCAVRSAACFATLAWLLIAGGLAGLSLRSARIQARLPMGARERWRTAALVIIACAVPIALFLTLVRDPLVFVAGMNGVIANMTAGPAASAAGFYRSVGDLAAAALPMLLVPIATVAMAIAGARRRHPLSVTVATGWAGAALPLAGLVAALYVGSVAYQARVEAHECARLGQRVTHEGRYYAARLNARWPD